MNKYLSKTHKSSGFISLIGVLGLVAIVLLATSLYFYMKKDNAVILPGNNATSTDSTNDTTRYAQKCGLKITFPTIGTTASFPLPLKGVIDNRNREVLKCSWTVFEAQAGTARVFANINNQGWKEVGYWGDNQSGAIAGPVPMMTVGDWMTENPVSVSATLMIDPKAGTIPAGTPMKIVIKEEDPSGMGGETLEVPFVYSGESVEMMELTVFFLIPDDRALDCSATFPVKRVVPRTTAVAAASMKILLDEALPSQLKDYYNGVTIKNKVAIVDFDKGALSILNGPACTQMSVKSPIEKTLLQYPTITKVEYSIDGKIHTEWDA